MDVHAILERRNQKDQLIKSEQSPFPPLMREKFSGLNYYSLGDEFYFEVEIEEYAEKSEIELERTAGKPLIARRFGRAILPIGEKQIPVEILDYEGNLAIIFKDKTNGNETYSGGRSLSVVPTADGKYIIDFNLATNPMSAYMSGYACPIPLPENHLDIAITAGEKLPEGAWVMMA